jgi:hypothetical protein
LNRTEEEQGKWHQGLHIVRMLGSLFLDHVSAWLVC